MSRVPALFLDRDGVINRDTVYTFRIEDIEFMPGVFSVARWACKKDLPLFVVTNQGGIAKGIFTESDFFTLTNWIEARFAAEGGAITQTYYSPYHPDGIGPYGRNSFCRKPQPGMFLEAAREHGIDLPSSIMVGDAERDMEAALRAGIERRVLFADRPARGSAATAFVHDHAALLNWLASAEHNW